MTTSKISDCNIGHGKDPEMNALATPIECDHCHAKIPASAALSFEGVEYIYHFCGPSCIAAWCKATNPRDK
jgi:Domain of unknown function (DUF3330)